MKIYELLIVAVTALLRLLTVVMKRSKMSKVKRSKVTPRRRPSRPGERKRQGRKRPKVTVDTACMDVTVRAA